MPTGSGLRVELVGEGGKRSRQRAGRVGVIASPVEGVVFEGDTKGEGANARVFARDSAVARTEEDSCS